MYNNDCPICQSDNEIQDSIWYSFSARLKIQDATKLAKSQVDNDLTDEDVYDHLIHHHIVQPNPKKNFSRSQALQEALSSFPGYLFYLLRALYRAKALNENQIYRIFYAEQADDPIYLRKKMEQDLIRLTFRGYLYKHWPENRGALGHDDESAYYFINRQSIPLVEKLELIPKGDLSYEEYTTSLGQIKEFDLEHDSRFLDCIVSMREKLYKRTFKYNDIEYQAHLSIEHWYSPQSLATEVSLPDGNESEFYPQSLIGLRVESRTANLSTILPLWIDYDRGIYNIEDIVESVLTYSSYFKSEFFAQKFPRLKENNNNGPLLVICDNSYRRDQILKTLEVIFKDKKTPVYLTDRSSFIQDPYQPSILYSVNSSKPTTSLMEVMFEHNHNILHSKVFSSNDYLDSKSTKQFMQKDLLSEFTSSQKEIENLANQFDLSEWE